MKTESEIISFLKKRVAALLQLAEKEIRTDVPLNSHYGLESIDLLTLGGHLEDWLGVELNPELMFKNNTIRALASAVFDQKAIY